MASGSIVAQPQRVPIGTVTFKDQPYPVFITKEWLRLIGVELVAAGNQALGGSGITALTGDVTATGPGSATATIANDAVTYAKMQNVSAASKLLGRGSAAGSGDTQEITLGTNLTMTGTTLDASGGLSSIADQRLIANISGAAAVPSANTLTAILDNILGSTQGQIITRNAANWTVLSPGASGTFLQSQGAGANLAYASGGFARQACFTTDGVTAITSNGTAFADVTTVAVSIAAAVGDVLEVEFSAATFANAGNTIFFQFTANGTAFGALVFDYPGVGLGVPFTVRAQRTVIAGDISAGVVPLKLQWKAQFGGGSTRNITNNANSVGVLTVKNFGH